MKLFALPFAMSSVVGIWLILIAAFVGIGIIVFKLLHSAARGLDSLFVAFWLGLAITLAGLQIWSLFWPINLLPIVIVSGIGSLGFISESRAIAKLSIGTIRNRQWTLLFAALLTLWLANRAIGPANLWDTRLYHINAVRWAKAYPAIPGIANLEPGVAYNSAYHLLAAMIDIGPLDERSPHVLAGLFLLVIGLRGVLAISRLMLRRSRVDDQFFALVFPIVFTFGTRQEAASLSSDLPAAVLTITSLGMLLAFLARSPDRRRATGLWITMLCLFASAVCCKLSTLGLVAVGYPLAILIPFFQRSGWMPVRVISIGCLIAIIFFVPWMARSTIMSGYPLFPTSLAPQNVEWRYPDDQLIKRQQWIRAHGRGESYASVEAGTPPGKWFANWIREAVTQEFDRTFPTVLLAACAFLISIANRARHDARLWLALAPALGATILWLVVSPAIRFGFAFPWSVIAILLAIYWPKNLHRSIIATIIILCAIPFARLALAGQRRFATLVYDLVIMPGTDHGFHPPQAEPYTTFTSRFGLTMYVPVTGDSCWNAPLPATHLRNADLRERSPGNLAKGFVTDKLSTSRFIIDWTD